MMSTKSQRDYTGQTVRGALRELLDLGIFQRVRDSSGTKYQITEFGLAVRSVDHARAIIAELTAKEAA